MRWPQKSRGIAVLVLLSFVPSLFPGGAWAQAGAGTPTAPVGPAPGTTASLDHARELIKDGEYDGAIEILRSAIGAGQANQLKDAYLLLIKSYVYLGNGLKLRSSEASRLNYQEAMKLIAECLQTPGLRHTEPVPASDYPPEMIESFAEVRGRIFGSFRIAQLEPRETVALLDADTLRAFPGDTLLGDVDIPIGQHLVHLRAPGYKHVDEEITIPPGSVLERSYHLARQRGPVWYATASSIAVAAVVGVVAIARGGSNGGETPGNLPEPPPPPTRARR